ncbi:MAG: putative outer rane drug efflux lipoprotein [Betaproteobacteria bacterium]|nr:putative outer rane drug efflux lipoprotein [Betaproteobacteria bacterium]
MKQNISRRTCLAAAVAAACLAGCGAIGPDYFRPAVPDMPVNWKTEPDWALAQPADMQPKSDWWTVFGDARLNQLEEGALAGNFNLQLAVARMDQANATMQSREAALYPRVEFDPSAARARTSANRPVANAGSVNSSTTQNDFKPLLAASYEIDLVGRVRRDVESARASAQQAQADRENVRLVLTAQVAATYFQLRQLDEEIRIVSEATAAQDKALDAIKKRYASGASGQADVLQQTALSLSNKAQLDLLKTQRNIQEDSLATLTGTPAASFRIEPGSLPQTVPQVPVTLPGALLQRRPDVASAERAMASANAQIGVAKAAFYPVFNLGSTFFGTEATTLAKLASASSILWSFGIAAAQTIFDGGRAKAGVLFAEAGYRGSVASYRQTVLVAIQESQDALSNIALLDSANQKQSEAVDNQNKSLQVSFRRYQGGLDNIIALTLVQQNQLAAQRVQSQIRGSQFVTTVSLIKALGGGWNAPAWNAAEKEARDRKG